MRREPRGCGRTDGSDGPLPVLDGLAFRCDADGQGRSAQRRGRQAQMSRRPGGRAAPQLACRRPKRAREAGSRRPAAGGDRQRAIDARHDRAREVGALLPERGRAFLDRLRRVDERADPERVEAGQRLPEQDADRPHIGGRAGGLAAQPLGRDVGERAGDVSDRGQALLLVHQREAEIEELHGDSAALGQQHVRRLDVAVDDAVGVGVSQALEHLGSNLERRRIAHLAGADRLAQRAARERIRRRCRCVRHRGRARAPAGSADDGAVPPSPPRARPVSRPFPRA